GGAFVGDQDGAAAHDLRGDAAGLEGGGRGAGVRARLALRPLRADQLRRQRALLRGVDAADRLRGRDDAVARRPDGGRQHVPPPGGAGEDGGDGRRDRRRPAGPRSGGRLERVRARQHGDSPLRAGGADPAAGRGVRDDQAPLQPAHDRLRRPLLPAAGGALRAEAGSAAAPAVRDRRRRGAVDAAGGRQARRCLELCRGAGGAVRPQGRRPAGALRGDRAGPRGDRPLGPGAGRLRRPGGGGEDDAGLRGCGGDAPGALPAATVSGGDRGAGAGRGGGAGPGV
ncbi:MAG: hypothetical protein AVDCRST_MAG19-2198, partial [uncultured Thermomicrobiales bacterium]